MERRRGPAPAGGGGAGGARTRAWWLARAYLNLVPTAAALAWGLAHGGRPVVGRDLLVECGGMRRGYARGGTTVGSVWLHGGLGGERRRRHESRHADQWAVLGPLLMPVLYGLEAALTRADPLRSRFERHAGLADGGYAAGPSGAPPGPGGRGPLRPERPTRRPRTAGGPTPDEVRGGRAARR